MLSELFEVQVVVQMEHCLMPVPDSGRLRDLLQPFADEVAYIMKSLKDE